MSDAGIDYGLGHSNIDRETGIRYGVISQHDISQALADSDLDYDYGNPSCPKCGGDATPAEEIGGDVDGDDEMDGSGEFGCERCKMLLAADEAFADEPFGWSYEGDGYKLTDCLDSDVFVLKSPFYTHAAFCSPCVPGAGNLNDAREHGVKTYCLGHDWFEDGRAPYPVFSVETNAEVQPQTPQERP